MATEYSPIEIAYFKAVVRSSTASFVVPAAYAYTDSAQLEQIMLAPNESYCVSSLAALREVNSLKSNMTKSQAEATLSSFVAKGWLLKSKCDSFFHSCLIIRC